jgi:hypothetical protein
MDTKLTLTLNKDIITEAKKYAAENNTSLSDLVENYFKALTVSEQTIYYETAQSQHPIRTPISDSIMGLAATGIPIPNNKSYKETITELLSHKYL